MARLALLLLVLVSAVGAYAKDGKSLKDFLKDDQVAGDWIYEDIDAGYARAKETGKPLLVCFSCVP